MKRLMILFLLLVCLSAFGEEIGPSGPDPIQFTITDFTFYGIAGRLVYNGLPFFPGLNTGLLAELGGGYFDGGYYKNPDGSDYVPPFDAATENSAVYQKMQFTGGLGILQGLGIAPDNKMNLAELFLIYRCQYQQHFQTAAESAALFYSSALYEKEMLLDNEIITGVAFNYFAPETRYRIKKGFRAETALLLGLPWLPGSGSDLLYYYQVAAKFWFYMPIYSDEFITVTIADRILADYCGGTYAPLLALQRFSGFDSSSGLGGALRGLSAGRYNGYLKAVNNTDLRLAFPNLIGFGFIPGIFGFFDFGTSDNTIQAGTEYLLLASTGLGISLQNPILDLALSFCYYINESRFPVLVFFTGYHF